MKRSKRWHNKPDAPNPAIARWFQVEHHWPGAPEHEALEGFERHSQTMQSVEEFMRRYFDERVAEEKREQVFPLGRDGFGNAYGYDLETGHIIIVDE